MTILSTLHYLTGPALPFVALVTIGAIITLGILMVTTAKVNWSEKFSRKSVPPPLENRA